MRNSLYTLPLEYKVKNVFKLIAKKQEEFQRVKKELEALLLTARLLEEGSKPSEHTTSDDSQLTQAEMAAIVLRAEGKPLHIKEIRKRIKKKFRRDIKQKTLTAVIYVSAKRGKYFYKDTNRKNTYGLNEWLVSGEQKKQGVSAVVQ